MKLTVDGLEKERDFYFGKLRDIELICQESESENPILSKIIDVLYATEVSTVKSHKWSTCMHRVCVLVIVVITYSLVCAGKYIETYFIVTYEK